MATANFRIHDLDFPLYAIGNEPFMFQILDEEDETTVLGEEFDDWAFKFWEKNLKERIEEYNQDLKFYKITTLYGYYEGLQLYVEAEHDLHHYHYDNEDCRYHFDMSKSEAKRKFKSEFNKVGRMLKKLAQEFGFGEYQVAYAFSNGETGYRKVD